jgi:hypothetical protein
MIDQEWLTALLGALKGADWAVECAGTEHRLPYAVAGCLFSVSDAEAAGNDEY